MVKKTENLHQQERAWDDSVLLQGKEKETGKKKREKEKHQEAVSQVVANLRNPFCFFIRLTPCHELAKGLATIAL